MSDALAIRPLDPFPAAAIEALAVESAREGFRYVRRLLDEHASGEVRFDGAGEVLLGVFDGDGLIAIGGVTRDPYGGEAGTGRVRHVYVHPAHRRGGVGARLLAALEAHARGHFHALVLRTDTDAAARFYEALGYRALAAGGTATHRRDLHPSPPAPSTAPAGANPI
ncbi:MAG TPA: GNAT family N-acetyltransferase [Longimicrobium sp.]|nr:GNAT family N-acetyltransferase [Longimicrobium sp.]